MNTDTLTLKDKIATHYELSKQLEPEYDAVYTDMVVYIRTSSITAEDAEEIVNDILVMMLEAQARGDAPENVFGNDYQAFCDEMITSMGKMPVKARIKDYMQDLYPSMNICLFFSWFNTLNVTKPWNPASLLTVELSAAFVLNMVFMLMSVVLVIRWLHSSIYKGQGDTLPKWRKLLPGVLIFVTGVFAMAVVSRTLDHYVFLRFHVGWLIGLMGALGIMGLVFDRRKKAESKCS